MEKKEVPLYNTCICDNVNSKIKKNKKHTLKKKNPKNPT